MGPHWSLLVLLEKVKGVSPTILADVFLKGGVYCDPLASVSQGFKCN